MHDVYFCGLKHHLINVVSHTLVVTAYLLKTENVFLFCFTYQNPFYIF